MFWTCFLQSLVLRLPEFGRRFGFEDEMAYTLPTISERPRLGAKQIYLMANGDLRLSANQNCWPAQAEMEQAIEQAISSAGWTMVRAHPYRENEQHGFIGS